MLRAWQAGTRAAVAVRIQRARDLEGRQVQEVVGAVSPGVRIADDVRPRKELAGSVVVIEQVDVEWAPATQCKHAVQLPSLADSRIPLPKVRQLITGSPDEPMPDVEIRIRALLIGPEAVVRLRCVGDVILAVRCVVDRVRPRVVDRRRKPMMISHLQARLQRVIIRVRAGFDLIDVEERTSGRRERTVVERPRGR